jgi:hypothetical protein
MVDIFMGSRNIRVASPSQSPRAVAPGYIYLTLSVGHMILLANVAAPPLKPRRLHGSFA